ncbi:MAG: hypothetical protein J6A33_08060 [Alphaproteobacteria bacterium]|nr:hypothetical protein [Alphaproteobacteria bacterium]
MSKKTTNKVLNLEEIEASGKKIVTQGVSKISTWSTKKKIIGFLMAFMAICVINCYLNGSTVMEMAKSSIHEIEALLYYVLAAINFCSVVLLGFLFEKE